MSEVKVNKISPRTACGTVTLGDSGDTFTIPSGATITNSGTATGFGATGAVNWVTTVKTSGFTATAGEGYFCDTTGGAFEVDLPAGSAGDIVAMSDYARTFGTNKLTVDPNGSEKIGGGGAGEPAGLTTTGQTATFVYVDGTQGWINTQISESAKLGSDFIVATGGTPSQCGDYEIRTFTGPGTFCVQALAVCAADNAVDYIVVAGGGGAGSASSGFASGAGGGGGAGGYRASPGTSTGSYTVSPLGAAPATAITVTATGYPISVGGGGAASPAGVNCAVVGTPGSDSIFSTITGAGGGGGGSAGFPTGGTGDAGGSGGGGGAGDNSGTGGAGNTPPTSPAQGSAGGLTGPGCSGRAGGGGGGATAAGATGPTGAGAAGGAGATNSINGTPTARAGGGAGGSFQTPTASPTPTGGGGVGGYMPATNATAGGTNTGGGGGGSGGGNCFSGSQSGGAGGSGVVILRYKYQ